MKITSSILLFALHCACLLYVVQGWKRVYLQPASLLPLRRSALHVLAATDNKHALLPVSGNRKVLHDRNVTIAENRQIKPGDYVVHQEFGVGKYLGVREARIQPLSPSSKIVPVVVVKYLDGELSVYEKLASKDLWKFRAQESGVFTLDSLIDVKSWEKKKIKAKSRSRE